MPNGILVSSYDLFNVADLDLIAQARAMCGRVVAAVLTDDDVIAATGWAPVVPLAGRMALMRHVRGVDDVIPADSTGARWGAGPDDIAMTSVLAESVGRGDVVLLNGRRTGSQLLSQLIPAGHRAIGEGVA